MPSGIAIEPRDDAAVELRRAGIDRDGVARARIADRLGAGVEHAAAAARPVLYGVPRTMKLSAASPQASRSHSRFDSNPPEASTTARRAHLRGARRARPRPRRRTRRPSISRSDDLGVVDHVDAEARGGRVVARSSAPCRRRGRRRWSGRGATCPERRLKAHADAAASTRAAGGPLRITSRASASSVLAAVHPQQIGRELVFGVGAR